MNRLVASRRPASPLLNVSKSCMIDPADHQRIAAVFGEVALEAKVGVADLQHLRVRAAVHVMTGGTPVPHGFVFKDIRAGLSGMALSASPARRCQYSLRKERLVLKSMRVVAIHAGDFPISHRMRMGQRKLPLYFKVALQACNRIATGIMNEMAAFTLFRVQAAGSVAGFTTILQTSLLVHDQTGMRRIAKIAAEVLMAQHAIFVSDKLGTRGLGNSKHRPVYGLTSYQTEQDGA